MPYTDEQFEAMDRDPKLAAGYYWERSMWARKKAARSRTLLVRGGVITEWFDSPEFLDRLAEMTAEMARLIAEKHGE